MNTEHAPLPTLPSDAVEQFIKSKPPLRYGASSITATLTLLLSVSLTVIRVETTVGANGHLIRESIPTNRSGMSSWVSHEIAVRVSNSVCNMIKTNQLVTIRAEPMRTGYPKPQTGSVRRILVHETQNLGTGRDDATCIVEIVVASQPGLAHNVRFSVGTPIHLRIGTDTVKLGTFLMSHSHRTERM